MTKRRTRPTTTSSTPRTTRTDQRRAEEQARIEAFTLSVQALFAHYGEHGCPCRFPRFRATAARDTKEVTAPGFTTFEHQAVVTLFDEKVPLRDRVGFSGGHEGHCVACGSHVRRWGDELFRGAFLEHLVITPAKDLVDVGAPLHGPVPHAWPFYFVGPEDHGNGRPLVEAAYPGLSLEDWFAWMRELAAT